MERKTSNAAKSQAPGNTGEARPPVRYPTAQLLESKALAGYQRDFARVLLTEPDYTIQEAKSVLEKFFRGGGR